VTTLARRLLIFAAIVALIAAIAYFNRHSLERAAIAYEIHRLHVLTPPSPTLGEST
jgi:hypothetical protein